MKILGGGRMKAAKKGEKGFTLIELLIVVAILGVLAAVIIPNVGRFLGRGESEARRTEFHNIASAVTALMVDNGISTIPNPTDYATGVGQNDLAYVDDTTDRGFPDHTTTAANKGYTGGGSPQVGYVLYRHDKIDPDDSANYTTVSYVNMAQTTYYYTCEDDGTVRQFADSGLVTEYTD